MFVGVPDASAGAAVVDGNVPRVVLSGSSTSWFAYIPVKSKTGNTLSANRTEVMSYPNGAYAPVAVERITYTFDGASSVGMSGTLGRNGDVVSDTSTGVVVPAPLPVRVAAAVRASALLRLISGPPVTTRSPSIAERSPRSGTVRARMRLKPRRLVNRSPTLNNGFAGLRGSFGFTRSVVPSSDGIAAPAGRVVTWSAALPRQRRNKPVEGSISMA